VQVESSYGVGTTFTVWLPVRITPAGEAGFGEPHGAAVSR